ncbi:MAG: CCA tRNA nucleotidyltransferase [Halovenus sp.]
MGDEFDAVCRRVRERVTPGPEERERVEATVEVLVERAEAAIADLPVDARVIQAGSTARDTWLAGDRDIDIFVAFPPNIDRERLEEFGLRIGHEVLPDGREEYAEHPYVVGTHDGFDVDFVPCYDVASAAEIQSAVDRTPFHTAYVVDRLNGSLAGDVRLCKAFLEGIGAYGSDLRTKGFSGFLAELLVLEYDGFRSLVAAAADWQPPVRLDPESHGQEQFEDPLVVVDPTDPERNVAAVCSAANVARLQHFSRELLAAPRESLFEPAEPDPVDAGTVRERFADRGTTPVAVRFDAPDIVDDQLWPQLERSLSGLGGELDRRGFETLRRTALATERPDRTAALLVELGVAERPRIERHEGPPVHVREHARSFYETYAESDAYGPFIEGDRYVVERERDFRTAGAFLGSDAVFDVALGVDIETALAAGYDVLVGDEVATLAGQFGGELARYLDPTPGGP